MLYLHLIAGILFGAVVGAGYTSGNPVLIAIGVVGIIVNVILIIGYVEETS